MQKSAKTLSPELQESIFYQLTTVLSDFNRPYQVDTFLRSFLTPTEQVVLAKRLAIARMLAVGCSYEEIREQLKVSSATIASVAEIIETPGIQEALAKLKIDDWADKIASKVVSIFKS